MQRIYIEKNKQTTRAKVKHTHLMRCEEEHRRCEREGERLTSTDRSANSNRYRTWKEQNSKSIHINKSREHIVKFNWTVRSENECDKCHSIRMNAHTHMHATDNSQCERFLGRNSLYVTDYMMLLDDSSEWSFATISVWRKRNEYTQNTQHKQFGQSIIIRINIMAWVQLKCCAQTKRLSARVTN